MEIRKMTIDDYDEVYKLWMSSKNMGFNDVDDSREGIEKYLRRNPDTSFVALLTENLQELYSADTTDAADSYTTPA